LYRGFVDELGPMDAAVIGGNLTATTEADFIDITLIGAVEPELLVRRSTGRLSHAVLVTGFPGRSAAGLKLLQKAGPDEDLSGHPLIKAYNRPVHRAREGRALARSGLVSAMIDTSDGLLGDLGHVCRESGLGADLFLERLPLDDDLKEAAAALEIKARDLVLGESDDYELIITCQADRVEAVRRAVASAGRAPVAEIGRLTEVGQGLRLIGPGGDVRRVRSAGWDHFSGSRP
ncbi:MAG: hypothetical protein KKB20_25380, partial [Proteobacteria bacterium]|nr:hypothetical protein [Pseudomonadota bacterium]